MRRMPDKPVYSRDSGLRNPHKIPQPARPAYALNRFCAGKMFCVLWAVPGYPGRDANNIGQLKIFLNTPVDPYARRMCDWQVSKTEILFIWQMKRYSCQ
jgi:hypothetical protein